MRGNTPPRVTMKDVAHRADVTIGTVSHVINRTAGVSLNRRKGKTGN